MCKWDLQAQELMKLKVGKLTFGQAVDAHMQCGDLLTRLRSGGRRSTYRGVRHNLREWRRKLVSKHFGRL